jgi:hypothetical protein
MRCYLILIINDREYVQICFWTMDNVQKHNREYGLTLKMKAICSSETSVEFQQSRCMCVGLMFVEVMWGAHLCNVSSIDWRMRSVMCCE